MADTDRFVFDALEQSGCLPVSAEKKEMKDLTSNMLMVIVWRCLSHIQESERHLELGISKDMEAPVGVAARHRVGSQQANILKELGYSGDCGYNHFLYPNEKETRSILSWLVSKLPSASVTNKLLVGSSGGSTTERKSADYLTSESLADTFSTWMKRKTLFVLPNRELPTLRGYEKLPLRTTRLTLPWAEEKQESTQNSDAFLFDLQLSAPATSVGRGISRTVSLLEAMAVAQSSYSLGSVDALDAEDGEADGVVDEDLSTFGGRLKPEPVAAPLEAAASFDVGGIVDLLPSFPPFFVSAANVLNENKLAQQATAPAAQHGDLATTQENKTLEEIQAAKKQEEEEEEAAQQAQMDQLVSHLLETQQQIESLRVATTHDQEQLMAIQKQVDASKTEASTLKKELTAKRQLLGLLPNAQENIAKLEAICVKNEAKLKDLNQEWEAHKQPLVEEERGLLAVKSNRKARYRQLVTEMKAFRVEMKEMAATIHGKMEMMQSLDQAYANLPQKNLSRHSYTNRIMDIIKQVHKQKQEISKIIDDIKTIQKQLNLSSEKLKRTEAVTEEKLFGEANKQAKESANGTTANPYVECYRKFAQVRELFEELIFVIGDVGKKENTARDLENWITQLQGRDSSEQLDKVMADLESVRVENASLAEKIKALRSM